MMTEAVGYVSGRSEVICGTWFLLAVLCGRRWLRGDGVRWAVLTIGLWVVALASKEIAAMLSLVLVACDWLVLGGTAAERRRRAVTVHLPLFLLAATAALIRLAILSGVEHPGSVAVHWSYLLIAVDVVRRYLWLLVNPAGQAAFHEVAAIRGPFEAQALIDLAVLAIVAAVVWRTRRIEPLASFGLVWFLLLLVPSSVLIVLDRGEPMAEHRVYLASCGAFLAAGATIGWIVARAAAAGHRAPLVARAVLTVGVLSLAVQTVLRNEVWSTPETLWRESVDRAPTHYRPRLLLGEAMLDAGRGEEAIEEFRVAVQLRPEEPAGYMKLGLGLAELRRFDEATATFKELEEVAPASPLPPIGLGTVAMQSRRLAQARQLFEEAIARDPGNVSARQSLALLAEMEEADPSTVLRLCEEIQRLAPWTPGNDECIRRNRSRLEIGSRHD
jgi:Flp pilus assembly protein TadD